MTCTIRVKVWKRHSTSTRLPRKELETRQKLVLALKQRG